MHLLHLARLIAIGLIVAACQPSGVVESSPEVAGPDAPVFVRCSDVPLVSADPELYRDAPIYVGNEMPVDEVRAWAAGKSGFEEIWIDRDRLGWITVAFSTDADRRQAELAEQFPGVGVVAVEVDWSLVELEALQRRVGEALGESMELTTWTSVQQGIVGVGVGVLKPERIAAVQELFEDAPICIDGLDPADLPAAGPQQPGGEAWRLLVDEAGAGHPYRTGIAFDEDSYARLWAESGVTGQPPPVDFSSEVVLWFGAVYGSSCPDLRLDDVIVDRERAIVHAEIVQTQPAMACTADANPRAYLVALERNRLPTGPFWIQLGAADPPGGTPEERTIVDVDLSATGSVAQWDEVRPDQRVPEPQPRVSGDIIETGYEALYRMSVHCGIEWLGELNAVTWRTDVPAGSVDFIPPEWEAVVDPDEQIDLVLLMEPGPTPTITATANGHSVVYHATAEDPPGCD